MSTQYAYLSIQKIDTKLYCTIIGCKSANRTHSYYWFAAYFVLNQTVAQQKYLCRPSKERFVCYTTEKIPIPRIFLCVGGGKKANFALWKTFTSIFDFLKVLQNRTLGKPNMLYFLQNCKTLFTTRMLKSHLISKKNIIHKSLIFNKQRNNV